MFEHLTLKSGKNDICNENFHNDMLMDVSVYILNEKEELVIEDDKKESAILLITGKVNFEIDDKKYEANRENIFEELPYCLHISKNSKVKIIAKKRSEILVQQKENANEFSYKYYFPENVKEIVAGEQEYEGSSKRLIRTIFDYETAPYSNLVIGEVCSFSGRWNSYPPHHHPQPEVYYYKFDHEAAFGVSVIGDRAEVVKNNSVSYIPGGLVHPQATAPGYRMYYVWLIPHLENNPWTERIFAKEHLWLVEK